MRKITRVRLEQFLERHASGERTLDVGAGGDAYKRFFPNRVTLDINPDNRPDIVGDAHELPFGDGAFTSILCTEVLEHLHDPPKAIAEMRRVLAPGGTLILSTRFVYPIHSASDYWRFTEQGMRKLFSDWAIVELSPETTEFDTIAVLLQRISLQSVMRFNKLSKIFLIVLIRFALLGNRFILRRYAHISRNLSATHIMASGYYLVAKKPAEAAHVYS